MNNSGLIISMGKLKKDQLKGNVALITGAGGGIGYEAARSLIWLGVKVVIGEINKEKGKKAEQELNREFGEGSALFVHCDIGKEKSIKKLSSKINSTFGKLDIIINNATVAPIGAVHKVGIDRWDLSYRTNLRGPVLLISEFLPEMIKRNSGIIVLVPSSGAAPYMGAYEVFKTAQVELSNTLAGELENTEVITYSIGPGIVKTETANKAIKEVAPLYGKSVEEFYKMSENVLITVEEAGAGFAASIALAKEYMGLEIGSIQALTDIGISIGENNHDNKIELSEDIRNNILEQFREIKKIFLEQINDWSNRPIFERQWLIRDFKKTMGCTPEYFKENLKTFENDLIIDEIYENTFKNLLVEKIYSYYEHQIDLLKGYEKDPDKVKEYTEVMEVWLKGIDEFKDYIDKLTLKEISK